MATRARGERGTIEKEGCDEREGGGEAGRTGEARQRASGELTSFAARRSVKALSTSPSSAGVSGGSWLSTSRPRRSSDPVSLLACARGPEDVVGSPAAGAGAAATSTGVSLIAAAATAAAEGDDEEAALASPPLFSSSLVSSCLPAAFLPPLRRLPAAALPAPTSSSGIASTRAVSSEISRAVRSWARARATAEKSAAV